MTAEVTEKEPGLVVADGIESNTTENVAKPCKSGTSRLADGQFEQFESICVADIEEMDVEGNVVDFDTEVGSIFKIPVKSKKKSCGKVIKQVRKDDGGSENGGDGNSSDLNLSQTAL
ncbi:Energy-coupling factor transporter ATP-binding protein EcfA1 [Labeo rohita]|uniref:Energy-coupling factor transporter ATP-binding protein EcfA1 n=1 Tax=Labeo rohita TaxID=84645 RepID=A0ABQ8LA21_LABRO|nr:Energy-coupling factor transporter ATP-binding protein EcfA1 [Labeo rohita]